jgi:hypothetical protein
MLIPMRRVRAVLRHEIETADFRYGESCAVPSNVNTPDRNYMNLFEIPMLFYVVCILAYVAIDVSSLMVTLAWAYVAHCASYIAPFILPTTAYPSGPLFLD